MAIRSDLTRRALPPPSRLDRGVAGVFHRGAHRRRTRRRRLAVAVHERRLGPRLDRELAGWATALHSRLPDAELECQPIDHLVVSPSGVWVIVADHRLAKLSAATAVASVAAQGRGLSQRGAACRSVLATIGFDWLDVHLVSCPTNARGAFRRPRRIDGVWIARPRSLTTLLARRGPLTPLDAATVAAELARRFPAAR